MEAWFTNRRQFLTLSGIGGILFLSGQSKISFAQIRRAEGYVTNTNKLIEILYQVFKEGKAGFPHFAELKRADYLEAFFKNIQWKAAEERLR